MRLRRQISNLVITGFSGTGKSLVGKAVAQGLHWDFIDTDEEIAKQAGKPIAEIFRCDGEARFRELERGAIREACQRSETVIAVGGGAIVDAQNYELLARTGLIICLEAKPETIYKRLFQEAAGKPGTEVRPLLAVENPLERICQLKASRQPHYAKADWTIHTDSLSISEAADEVIRAWRLLSGSNVRKDTGSDASAAGAAFGVIARHEMPKQSQGHGTARLPRFARNDISPRSARNDATEVIQPVTDKDVACVVKTETQSYPIYVGHGLLNQLGEKIRQVGLSGTAITITDETVYSLYGKRVQTGLKDAGLSVGFFVVPPGEETKAMEYAIALYDFLVKIRAKRNDIIVALGGGVVGDLAGFVAATFVRGMPWVQVPTSLVAMVDASIGGKVGVNHPDGKNLIGTFYQPNLVLADPQTLTTLPERELTSGWAEVIKHGLTLDAEFVAFLEKHVDELTRLEPNAITEAIARSAAIKAAVVSQDEKETKGKRTILNYGHTIGHALEAATHYKRFLHGEAVAIGMMGDARLSERLGLLSPEAVERQQVLLGKFGLATSLRSAEATNLPRGKRSGFKFSLTDVTKAMELDKKMKGKAMRWVLLEDVGKAVIRSDVPQDDVLAILRELIEMPR